MGIGGQNYPPAGKIDPHTNWVEDAKPFPSVPYITSSPVPSYPTWESVVQLQFELRQKDALIQHWQQQIIDLQAKLVKLQNTKDWLVGPETGSTTG